MQLLPFLLYRLRHGSIVLQIMIGLVAGMALALMMGAGTAQARNDVYWSVGVGAPGVALGVPGVPGVPAVGAGVLRTCCSRSSPLPSGNPTSSTSRSNFSAARALSACSAPGSPP